MAAEDSVEHNGGGLLKDEYEFASHGEENSEHRRISRGMGFSSIPRDFFTEHSGRESPC